MSEELYFTGKTLQRANSYGVRLFGMSVIVFISPQIAIAFIGHNVFYRHFARYRHFDRRDLGLHSTMTATATSKTSNIYYVMCLGARFYEYLASSEVKNELSSKLVTVTLVS
jgi:hypothetical protein